MQTTLVLLKPDCVAGAKVGETLKRFEDAGFRIRGCKMFQANTQLLTEHYQHLANKPFFPEILAFMQSSPVIALALVAESAVDTMRELIGPTDPQLAKVGTLRGDFGSNIMANMVHASDSVENAEIELQRFFQPQELFDYTPQKIQPLQRS